MPTYSERLPSSLAENTHSRLISERRKKGLPLLDLSVSNPTVCFDNYPHASINAALSSLTDFTYNPDPFGNIDARKTICDYYQAHRLHIDPQKLVLTASTSEAYSYLFKLLCDPYDEVLVPVPSYPLFTYLGALESVRVVPYHLRYDGSWYVDLQSLKSAITAKTKAIVTVNPNNPTGTFLTSTEREQMLSLASESNLAVIADEVFADYSLASEKGFLNSFAVNRSSALSFSLNGLSKAAGMPQMKLAWIIASGPEEATKLAMQGLEMIADTFLSVGTVPQKALPGLLEIGSGIRATILDRVTRNLAVVDGTINNTAIQRLQMDGGWSAILRLPGTQSEEYWVTSLIEEHGLITQPGYFFDMPHEAHLVVSLITPPADFETGVERLCSHVTKHLGR